MKHILSILSLGFIAYVQAQVYKGNYCEYIVPTDLPAKGNNCNNDGYKFVVKGNNVGANKIRKQFLYVDGKVIIAFVENGKKFADCTSFTDVTGSVNCKLVTGLPGTSLTSTSGGGGKCSKCGVKGTNKIVGGVQTKDEFPWFVALSFSKTGDPEKYGCGATLISSEWVVCASHCIISQFSSSPVKAADITLVLGDNDKKNPSSKRKVFKVSKIITHPGFVASTYENDIALFKLATKVDLSVFTPACLPSKDQSYTGKIATVYGFGDTKQGGTPSDVLLKLDVPVVSLKDCQDVYGSMVFDTGMLCAGGKAGEDSCQGDSGGPLTLASSSDSSQNELIGVVSWGRGCAQDGVYGVYADVSYFRTFIDDQIKANGGATFCSG